MEPRFHVFEIDGNGKMQEPRDETGSLPFDRDGYEDPDDAEAVIKQHGKHDKQYVILPIYSVSRR